MRCAYPFIALIAASLVAGCAHVQIDEAAPSIETLKILRGSGVPSMATGRFLDAGGKKPIARTVNIRGSTMRPPKGEDFAGFLRLAFEGELKAAGKFDAAAPVSITARLTESHAGENMAKGGAALGAEISLVRGGAPFFTKAYRVETKWQSEFIGALAIPEAFRQYNALYPTLVRQVFADPEFVGALKR
jgi:hypothetical protein